MYNSKPINYKLKNIVDTSLSGEVETLYQADFSGQSNILNHCELTPEEVGILIERLRFSSIEGDNTYDYSNHSLIIIYPFTSFWYVITNHILLAQYTKEYSIKLQLDLKERLKLSSSKYPHHIKIKLNTFNNESELHDPSYTPHDVDINDFDCRALIISHATYVDGMLDEIIKDHCKKAKKSCAGNLSFDKKIKFCLKRSIINTELLSLVNKLRELRNEAAHQYEMDDFYDIRKCLHVHGVTEILIEKMKNFIESCEARYKLRVSKTDRFYNCFRMIAGELNKDIELTQHLSIGIHCPEQWKSYFYW